MFRNFNTFENDPTGKLFFLQMFGFSFVLLIYVLRGFAMGRPDIGSGDTACSCMQVFKWISHGFSSTKVAREVLQFCMWNFVSWDKAQFNLSHQTKFHIQKCNTCRVLDIKICTIRVFTMVQYGCSRARGIYHCCCYGKFWDLGF